MDTRGLLSNDLLFNTLIAIATANALVTLGIALYGGYTWRQKIMQIALIWLLPALGCVILGVFLVSDRSAPRLTQRTEESSQSRDLARMVMSYRRDNP